MKQCLLTVINNEPLNATTYKLTLEASGIAPVCGQFAEVALPSFTLRRPFGVADYDCGVLTLLYKVVGEGTKAMRAIKAGDKLDVLAELGNGFRTDRASKPLIIGGGIGIAPLYYLAKTFASKGIRPTAVLAFRNEAEALYIDEFKVLCDVVVATDDGSLGYHGNALGALNSIKIDYDYYYACGPMPMLRALASEDIKGEISLEARMGCGFGACMGCSIMTVDGAKRVCKEGPVFDSGEVIF